MNKPNCKFPTHIIRKGSIRNPLYTCVDYYIMTKPPQKGPAQVIHRSNLEPYYADFIHQGIIASEGINADSRQYYDSVVTFIKGAYYDIREKGILYSNLTPHDSAIILIRRSLDNLGMCQDEILKLGQLFDLRLLEIEDEIEVGC